MADHRAEGPRLLNRSTLRARTFDCPGTPAPVSSCQAVVKKMDKVFRNGS
jgi:hypothetical protein